MLPSGWNLPVASTMNVRTTRITTVRTRVAKSLSIFAMPILAKIAVSEANTAESSAQNSQLSRGELIAVSHGASCPPSIVRPGSHSGKELRMPKGAR
jgi:hypothetical protein